ncbi:SDR family NAD(P)-dependent oxidoreductase [Chitinimonas arctica]|uniref:SDR family NAD(P)-dependent oxidoreductase n=1 Tax=Chitinimonas arctica TaxID=2594795 RepID=A0A516SAT1_9NEIS|nr:SDR family NAD(P)-dependent oxidoreductase [Chitinimonas arctica]QDQ25252.1 SDR family NAD(P)-dependent oxidoreductase [Chitinimonas arctica]
MSGALYILTGASRGLGLGIARAIAARGGQLLAVARSESAELAQLGRDMPGYRFFPCDLADAAQLEALTGALCGALGSARDLYLINNAGVTGPIAPAGRYQHSDLVHCLAVNLTAAMHLSNAFIAHVQERPGDRRILNISSGAGRNPYPSWTAYCTSKAGLDMYSRCVGVEQAEHANGIRIAAVAPGIIDTDMQADIRASTPEDFPLVERFKAYQADGALSDPDRAGADLLRLLHGTHMGFGDLLDIRTFAS